MQACMYVQFGAQEPGDNEQVKKFARERGAKFPMMSKVDVNGAKGRLLCKIILPGHHFLRTPHSVRSALRQAGLLGASMGFEVRLETLAESDEAAVNGWSVLPAFTCC